MRKDQPLVELPPAAFRLLKRWGFTPQKPKRVAYEQDPEEVEHWLETENPAIKKQAKAEKAHIYWGDEIGARADDQRGSSYSPRGAPPIISATGKRFGCKMVSALSNRNRPVNPTFFLSVESAILPSSF